MPTVLVTGGAGFIGSHTCEKLLDHGEEVVCVDNLNDYYSPEVKKKNIEGCLKNDNFRFYKTDIRDKESMQQVFKENNIEKIIHLAARAGVRPSIEQPLLYADVNINGTLNLLELSREHSIKNFVFGSSSSVYGVNSKVPFSEDDKIDKPISPYAATKAAGELLCHAYSHLYGIPVTCLRFFTVYGPRGRPDMAPLKFTKLTDEGKEIHRYGDGSSKRDYTYVDDIVSGILSANEKAFKYEIFNLGNSQTVELRRLIEVIEENVGKEARITQLPAQPGDVPITYADIKKAKSELGYNPKIPIEEGIKKLVDWYKKVKK